MAFCAPPLAGNITTKYNQTEVNLWIVPYLKIVLCNINAKA